MRKRSNTSVKFLKSLLIFILILLFFLFLFFGLKLFTINIIAVKITNAGCVLEKSISQDKDLLGSSLLFINLLKKEEKLKKQLICIKKISFAKQYPHKISLEIFGRNPKIAFVGVKKESTSSSILTDLVENEASNVAQIQYKGSDLFISDDEGVIFSKDSMDINIPVVYFFNRDFKIGDNLGYDLILNINNAIQSLSNLGLKSRVLFLDAHELLLQDTGFSIILSLKKDLNLQIASLQLILEKAKIEKGNVEFIDLRFDKPIIKFATNKN